jgi:multimeric flavodoxin WrbA
MNITILNGDLYPENSKFTGYLEDLSQEKSLANSVQLFNLAKMNLNYCAGCWSCWWKTPGQCVHKDDARHIFRAAINSDLLVLASPLVAGFTSSLLKRITDRLIVLIHPYTELRQGECHHKKRYEKYPELALIIDKEESTDEEDIQIIRDIYERLAINFHSKLQYIKFADYEEKKQIDHDSSSKVKLL